MQPGRVTSADLQHHTREEPHRWPATLLCVFCGWYYYWLHVKTTVLRLQAEPSTLTETGQTKTRVTSIFQIPVCCDLDCNNNHLGPDPSISKHQRSGNGRKVRILPNFHKEDKAKHKQASKTQLTSLEIFLVVVLFFHTKPVCAYPCLLFLQDI